MSYRAWIWYVATAILLVVATAVIVDGFVRRDTGRWTFADNGAMILDTHTGVVCIIGSETCFPAPAIENSGSPSRAERARDSAERNPFDGAAWDTGTNPLDNALSDPVRSAAAVAASETIRTSERSDRRRQVFLSILVATAAMAIYGAVTYRRRG